MSHAYTPGLKVSKNALLLKERTLPVKGEVLATLGQVVSPDDVVARTYLPGKVQIVNVANSLGVDQSDVPDAMTLKEGDSVDAGGVVARSQSFFGLFKSEARSPMEGTVESVSGVTGQVIIRGNPQPVEVRAFVKGKVVEVVPEEGVHVETCGTFIQGIFGIGGETSGEIVMGCNSPKWVLDKKDIKPEFKDKIIVGGSLVTAEALKEAIKIGAKGVVVGGFDDKDLRGFLGYDLGVAITGHEKIGITLIVTEGFGQIDMAPRTYELLKSHEGHLASINGATQIRAGVIRPEVIIPMDEARVGETSDSEIGGLHMGTPVRIIRAPHFGALGTVSGLPTEPAVLESGSKARVAQIKLVSGEEVIIPRANLELIEE